MKRVKGCLNSNCKEYKKTYYKESDEYCVKCGTKLSYVCKHPKCFKQIPDDVKENYCPVHSVAEAIENNIRKQVVQKITINPAYYNKMSEVLEQLILDRKRGTLAYKQLLNKYLELAKSVTKPEDNTKYPESIRGKSALRSLYDNCGEDEHLAIQLHNAVLKAKMDGFRGDLIKSRKVKKALFGILKNEDEVERVYNIVVEQEEY